MIKGGGGGAESLGGTEQLEVLSILKGEGEKKLPPFKWGGGGVAPLAIINVQSFIWCLTSQSK